MDKYWSEIEHESSLYFEERVEFALVLHNNEIYVINGVGKYDVWKSKDGLNWEQLDDTPFKRSGHTALSFNDKIVLIGGYN